MADTSRPGEIIACAGVGCPIRFNCGKFFRMNYKDKCHMIQRATFYRDDRGKPSGICRDYEMIK